GRLKPPSAFHPRTKVTGFSCSIFIKTAWGSWVSKSKRPKLVTSLFADPTSACGALMSGLAADGAPYRRWPLKEFVGPTPTYSGSQAL
ncbi:hypothetical protein QUA79_06310, partial [Microcoleus sp. F8-D1]